MSRSQRLDVIKSKKNAAHAFFIGDNYFNHPHRLASVGLSGSMIKIADGRLSSSAGLEASLITSTYTGSLYPEVVRRLFEKDPVIETMANALPAKGEICMGHLLAFPWRIYVQHGPLNDSVTVGTRTDQRYTRSTMGSPWVAGSLFTYDITDMLQCSITGGGSPTSGGRDAEDDTEKASILIAMYEPAISGTIKRFPWDDPWASETGIFTDHLAAWIAAGNAIHGAGYSGSCSLSLDFN